MRPRPALQTTRGHLLKKLLIAASALLVMLVAPALVAAHPISEGDTVVAAAKDTDGDGIPDSVELSPHFKQMGLSPRHKDIVVECVYMQGLKPNVTKLKAYANSFF